MDLDQFAVDFWLPSLVDQARKIHPLVVDMQVSIPDKPPFTRCMKREIGIQRGNQEEEGTRLVNRNQGRVPDVFEVTDPLAFRA